MSDAEVRFEVLGWPATEPTLRLDHRQFAYAGKFVLSGTGKAVLRPPERSRADTDDGDGDDYDRGVLAAVSFDADRTDPDCLVLRYITVRQDRRGEGLGPALVLVLLDRVADGDREFDRVRIAVNNAFAYEALSRAGFAYTGDRSGLAEVVLARPVETPADRTPDQYRAGLDALAERDVSDVERAFLERCRQRSPPAVGSDVTVDTGDTGD